MPTTLRMIVDQVVAPVPGPLGVYTQALTDALIRTAPRDCEVEGIVSSSPPGDYDRLAAMFPGLAGLYKTTLARRELAAAWQLGLTTSPGGGIIHAPGLFAPLRRHDRSAGGDQVVVTVHDLLAWTHPESLTNASVAWHRAMMKRARKHADAVVVPTHALAERLADGGRLRRPGARHRHRPATRAAHPPTTRASVPHDWDSRRSTSSRPARSSRARASSTSSRRSDVPASPTFPCRARPRLVG